MGTTQVWGTDGAYAGGIENEAVWAGMLSMHAGVGVQFGWGSMASCTGAYLDMTMFGITATHNFDTGQNSVGVSAQASYYMNANGTQTLNVPGATANFSSRGTSWNVLGQTYNFPSAAQVAIEDAVNAYSSNASSDNFNIMWFSRLMKNIDTIIANDPAYGHN